MRKKNVKNNFLCAKTDPVGVRVAIFPPKYFNNSYIFSTKKTWGEEGVWAGIEKMESSHNTGFKVV